MSAQHGYPDLLSFGKPDLAKLTQVQKELTDTLEAANRHWLERVKSETESASALMTKLRATRSVPDATAVYQDWFGQCMQRLAEDSRKGFTDGQKMISTWTKLVSNGWSNGST